ncbi:triple tyrosine motif-containing protein [Aquimarina aquimarini]|uniref:helix-turn-helix and ligand-binding sensor domain-containing protein n=1 Tax=Aquimarina aquimarini TaxID=1191734 RepID=UPI000D55D136|nr:triple tyrosine motif-containing protein [Aquimarina aquimarini]
MFVNDTLISREKRFLLLLFLFPILLSSQELPPIETYVPENYGGETQNWSISQSNNKYIYVANNKGLLEFNGATWVLYPTPNETVMRSVRAVSDRIYTGFYMNFGYWIKNDFGKLEYNSLSDEIKDNLLEDEQFWGIVNHENRVLFRSLDRIYIYNTDTEEIDIIKSKNGIQGMFTVGGEIYYQDTTRGILKIKKGEPVLLTDFPIANNDQVINIFQISDGVLMLTKGTGFYTWSNDEGVRKWEIPADEIIRTAKVYSGIQLRDKSFALGTISKGIMYLSPKGEIIHQINQHQGLHNNTVLSLFEDVDTNIWLGLDNGINCINIKSPIRFFNDYEGNIGTVYASIVFEDLLYLGTNQGLFYKKMNTNDPFRCIEGTKGQVWSLFEYDNTLFCGHDSGTFLIHNNTSKTISTVNGGWIFKTIPEHPNWLLQGTYTGLCLFEKKDGKWDFKHKIEGIDYSARYIEIEGQEIWINHEYKGLFKVEMNKEFNKILDHTKEPSIPKGKNSNIVTYKEYMLYAHEGGVFVYDKQSKRFVKESIISQISGDEKYHTGKLIKDNTGGLWVFSQDNIGYISSSQFSDELKITEIPISRSLRKEMFGFENITQIKEGVYLSGTTSGYMILDLSQIKFEENTIILDKVSVKNKNTEFEDISLLATKAVFDADLNTISFSYAIPEYDVCLRSNYQYKLNGFYENWSSWKPDSQVVFENLPYGEYTFMVRAKIGNKLSENIAEYSFRINSPWYLSTLAMWSYFLSICLVLFLIHKMYKRYYTLQNQKMIEENKKQLALKELEKEREIMRLTNEKLSQDIESKNRELASSTMHVVKKNEILNKIKKELQKSETRKKELVNVEKIIDKNLNHKDDWKHFEEAFNNTDRDFLNKLKAKHADLTPNDLRFCTYLRLNLSSKEIAPLLNISVRSVEIKRYRLRKKLCLSREQSLVNYILEL